MMRTAVLRLRGQDSRAPTGVFDQSTARMRAPISPPPRSSLESAPKGAGMLREVRRPDSWPFIAVPRVHFREAALKFTSSATSTSRSPRALRLAQGRRPPPVRPRFLPALRNYARADRTCTRGLSLYAPARRYTGQCRAEGTIAGVKELRPPNRSRPVENLCTARAS